MDIDGKTPDGAAYRITVEVDGEARAARVPDALLSAEYGRDATVSHQEAYEWIASNAHAITDAVAATLAGRTPRAPYDQITLA